jgi:hypothetical protein
MLLSDRFAALADNSNGHQRSEEAERLRADIRKSMGGKNGS